jgi:putative flippase GtrA
MACHRWKGESMSPARALANRIGVATRRPANWMQLLRFGVVGGSGYLINLAVFAVLAGLLGMHHVLAAVVAFCVAVSSNFFWNRRVLEALVVGASVGKLAAQAIALTVAMPFNFANGRPRRRWRCRVRRW